MLKVAQGTFETPMLGVVDDTGTVWNQSGSKNMTPKFSQRGFGDMHGAVGARIETVKGCGIFMFLPLKPVEPPPKFDSATSREGSRANSQLALRHDWRIIFSFFSCITNGN